ncbi:MAG: fibronectin type III domain-containing protein, partial [Betaproteobacteria bacterium]|nr:fibronectin type III domain-containing protein [Betaproteobacteria bacterium]
VVNNLTGGTAYSCTVTATNDIGTSGVSNALSATPYGKASAPTMGTATGGTNQISVAFTAPLNDGGSAITGYRAVCGIYTATNATSPVVVTGIPGGVSLACQVAAITTAGDGVYSAYSNAALAVSAPGAPTGVTATAGNAQIAVAFTAPSGNGGSTITGYTATCGAFTASGSNSPLVVTGLTNGTAYTCSVAATNAIGTSTASTTASATPRTVPDAPTAVVATAVAGGSVSVAFTAPASNGGAAITSYTATCGTQSGSGAASPVTVTGLTVGVSVSCTVTATNAAGSSAASAASNSATPFSSALNLAKVESKKAHGALGDLFLPIDTAIGAITGNVTVEPRTIGSGHHIVFTFDGTVGTAGTVSVVNGSSMNVGSPTVAISGSTLTVTLTAIPDNSRVAITLSGVNGASSAFAAIGFLIGDVNSDRKTNATDVSAMKTRTGATVNSSNFVYDANLSGIISAADVAAAKVRSGTVLP